MIDIALDDDTTTQLTIYCYGTMSKRRVLSQCSSHVAAIVRLRQLSADIADIYGDVQKVDEDDD